MRKINNQKEFLTKLGILQRAEILTKNMPFSKKADIYFRVKKLIDVNHMGNLFKVIFITNKKNKFNFIREIEHEINYSLSLMSNILT